MTKKKLIQQLSKTIDETNQNFKEVAETLHLFAKTMGYTLGVEDYISKEYVYGIEKKVIKQRPVLIPIKGKK